MNIEHIRQDFPVLQQQNKIIYFDNACVTLKPKQVVDAMREYYEQFSACGGRSIHKLGNKVSESVEQARKSVAKFVDAKKQESMLFTRNATEAINLVTHGLNWEKNDLVLTTDKEHNSNLIPFQQLSKQGVRHEIIKTNKDNTFSMEHFQEALTKKPKLVALNHVSNLDGVENPVKEIIKQSHDAGALVLIDGAQSAPHKEISMKKLNPDFYAFSGHKMLGPSGTGALYGRYELLEEMQPFITGGSTVVDTTYATATFEKPPMKFEAGLQDYAGIMGFGEAVQYLKKHISSLHKHEHALNKQLTDAVFADETLATLIKLVGPKDPSLRGGIFSFLLGDANVHDVSVMLDASHNIAIRSGAHCVHSWFNDRNIKGSARASFYLYNTPEEVDQFVEALKKLVPILGLAK